MASIPADASWETLLVNSGVTGVTEVTSALVRTGRRFAFINGTFDATKPWAELSDLVAAAFLKRKLDGARIGMIGHPYQWMSDLMVDPLEVMDRFGVVLEYVEEGELIAAVSAQRDSEAAAAYLRTLRSRMTVEEMSEEALQRSAEYSVAVAGIAKDRGFSALSFYEQGMLLHPEVGLTGALAMCELYSRGIPCTSEGDLLTLILMLAMKHRTGEATFLEHYGMDFDRNSLLVAHDSFGNWELADKTEGIVLEPTIFYQGTAGAGAAARFRYRPGPVTLGSLTIGPPGMPQRFRMIAAEGESLPFTARPIPAPQMEFQPDTKDIDSFYRGYCTLGGGHHLAACYGREAAMLKALSDAWGIDFHEL
jgi:L-arabinose isomerase